MLTILTLSLVAVILVLGRHVFATKPKMQPIKIKSEENRTNKRRY